VRSAVDLISRKTINTIYFDLDGTLRYNRPSFLEALAEYNMQLGLPIEIATSIQGHRWLHNYWAQSPDLIADRKTFGEDEGAFWVNHSRRYLEASGCQPEQAQNLAPELTECMRERYSPVDTLADQADELLHQLQQNGFRLGVISNRTDPFDEQLEALGIRSYFEYSLAAGTIDAWKPDPLIFQHALTEMNIKSEQAVYVGDNYFADVVGARNAGIQPILIDPVNLFPEADCVVIDTISDLEFTSAD
jgi:HAD superfamily hydrolase (TIGR01549 family)